MGIELQRTLGWVDIDGDGIAELEDDDAYGGWEDLSRVDYLQIEGQYINSNFEKIEEINMGDCKFVKILLEDGSEGLVPLECEEYNLDIVNIYYGVLYTWDIVQSEKYGTVFLARLR